MLHKALYGFRHSDLIFYLKLATDLSDYGFVINLYNPWVAKKLVSKAIMTLLCHVDDLKWSHKKYFEVTKFAKNLSTIYINKLRGNRGNIHDYLWMDLDYSQPVLGEVSIIKYPQHIMDEFTEELRGKSATTEADHIFQMIGE